MLDAETPPLLKPHLVSVNDSADPADPKDPRDPREVGLAPNGWRLGSVTGRAGRLIVVAFAVVAVVLGAGFVAIPVLVLLVARLLPGPSVARRVALAILTLFGANAGILTSAALLGLPLNPRLLTAGLLVVTALAAAPDRSPRSSRSTRISDFWSVGAAAITFGVFYRPFVGVSLGRRLALLSGSTDAGNHLSYVRIVLEAAGYDHTSQYPQAWAGNVAIAIDLMVGNHPSARTFIGVAVPLIIAFYALLTFFAVTLACAVVLRVVGHLDQIHAATVVGCVCLSTVFGSSVLLMQSASYTEIFAVTVLLALGGMLASPTLGPDFRHLMMVGLLSLALMQTWYLLAPVLGVLVIMYLVAQRPAVHRVAIVGVPCAALALYPIVKGPPAVAQVNAVGGTAFPSAVVVLTLFALTLVGLGLSLGRGASAKRGRVLQTLVLATLMLTTVIIVIQKATGSGINYYVAKLLLSLFVFAAALSASVVAVEADRLVKGRLGGWRRGAGSIAVLAVLVGGYVFAAVAARDQSGSYALGAGPPFLDGRVLEAVFTAHPDRFDSGSEAWIVDGCSRGIDRLANKWSHDLYPKTESTWNDANFEYLQGHRGDARMLIKRAATPEVQKMEIYVHHECDPDAVRALAKTPKVTIIHVP